MPEVGIVMAPSKGLPSWIQGSCLRCLTLPFVVVFHLDFSVTVYFFFLLVCSFKQTSILIRQFLIRLICSSIMLFCSRFSCY